jgi:TRAP-type transport system periplasmic protein
MPLVCDIPGAVNAAIPPPPPPDMPKPVPPPPRRGIRRRLLLRAAVSGGLAVPFLARGAVAAVTWTLFSTQTDPSSAVSRGLRRMADLVRDRSNGAMLINVRTAGLMPFDANQVLEVVGGGKVEMGDDSFHAATIGPAAVMRLPLLINTPEEWDKVAGIVRPVLTAEVERRGMVLLAHYRTPMQLFWSRQKAGGFVDIARQRLRVQSVEQAEFARHYAGLHVITSTVEAAEALAAGKLDGTFGTAAVAGRMWKAWLKHVYLAGPNYNDAVIVAGREVLERLPEGLAAIIQTSAAETVQWLARTQDTEEMQQVRALSNEGLRFTPANAEEVREGLTKLPAYWDSWVRLRSGDTEKLLATIRESLDR